MSSKFMKNAFVGWTFTAGLYYPPDFDASKLIPLKHLKPKGPAAQMLNIRMMFPFTMVCDACGEYNYTGTKFTAKVEQIKQESYLTLKVYRFYGRCRHCWAEFTFKTDPKNSDYTMESGGKRTYEAWKDADMMESQMKAEKEKDRENDQMKALEQKSVDVQAEMQRLEDLDAIRTMNKRMGAREQTIEEALSFIFERGEKQKIASKRLHSGDAEELEGFKEAQQDRKRQKLDDALGEDSPEEEETPAAASSSADGAAAAGAGSSSSTSAPAAEKRGAAILSAVAERTAAAEEKKKAAPKFSVKKKASAEDVAAEAAAAAACAPAGLGLLGAYDSDSSGSPPRGA